MKRKIVAMLMVMSLAFLTACGSVGNNAGQDEKEAVSTETVVEVEEEQEEAVTEEKNEVEEETEKEAEMETVYLVSKEKSFSTWGGQEKVEFTQYTYDEFGNELTCETRAEDGTLTKSISNEYDENGYLVKTTYVDEEGESITIYENNESGNVVKKVSDYSIYIYEYDENGTLRKESWMDKDNHLDTIQEYDENGTLRKTVYYNENDEIDMLYEYNEHGDDVLSQYAIDENTIFETVYINEYDANGNLIKVIETSSDGTGESTEEITEYEYDADNNRVKESMNEGEMVIVREYDKNNNLVKVTEEYYGEVSIFEYEYDEYGNNLKTVSYDKNGVVDYQVECEYISMELPKKDK